MLSFMSTSPALLPVYMCLVDNRTVCFNIDNYHQPSNLDCPNNQPLEGNIYKMYVNYNCNTTSVFEPFIKHEDLKDPSKNEPDFRYIQSYFRLLLLTCFFRHLPSKTLLIVLCDIPIVCPHPHLHRVLCRPWWLDTIGVILTPCPHVTEALSRPPWLNTINDRGPYSR